MKKFSLSSGFVFHCTAALLAVVALFLRLHRIDVQELWLDEALTAHLAVAPGWLDYVHNTPPLYYMLMRIWSALYGVDEYGLRLFSALAGALFVWITPYAARRVFGATAGLVAGLLALLAPIHIYYSQEARAYALMLTELMFVFWMLWRLKDRHSTLTWILLVLGTAATLYTHYLSAIPIGLAYLVIGFWRSGNRLATREMSFVWAGITALALVAPWTLWWMGKTSFEPRDMEWLAALWKEMPGIGSVLLSIQVFSLGPDASVVPVFLKQFTDMAFSPVLKAAGLLSLTAVFAIAIARIRSETTDRRRALIQCLVLLFGPLLCLWAISFRKPMYFPARYDLIAFPAFVLAAGYTVSRAVGMPRKGLRPVAVVLTAILVGTVIWKDVLYFKTDPAPGKYAPVAAYLDNTADPQSPQSLVVFVGHGGLPVLAELYQLGYNWSDGVCRNAASGKKGFNCRMIPFSLESAPAAVTRYERAVREQTLARDLEVLLSRYPWATDVVLVLTEPIAISGEQFVFGTAGYPLVELMRREKFDIVGISPSIRTVRFRRRPALPADTWTFVSLPDFLNADTTYPQPGWEPALDFILEAVKQENPDVLLVEGDLLQGRWWTEDAIRKNAAVFYPAWIERMTAHGLKFYAAIGDHEIGDLPGPAEAVDHFDLYKAMFRQYVNMPTNGPDGMKGTAYHFVHKNTLFVSMDVFAKNSEKNEIEITIGPEQQAWFEKAVAEHPGVDHIIVMGHTPVVGPVTAMSSSALMLEGRDESPFWKSMVANKVAVYLCGEVHCVNCVEKNGLMQVAHGSLLGFVPSVNYLVATVSPGTIHLEIKELPIRNTGGFLPQAGWDKWLPTEKVGISAAGRRRGFVSKGEMLIDKTKEGPPVITRTGCFVQGQE